MEYNPEDTSMKDVLDKADSFKVALKMDEKVSQKGQPADVCSHPVPITTVQCDAKCKDAWDIDKPCCDSDTRWQLVYDKIGFAGTDIERQAELRKLSKPFLHELHKWYSENKPTEFVKPVLVMGKRPIPEMNFSHL